MALTLQEEQKLESVRLIALFEKSRGTWLTAAERAYKYLKIGFPPNSVIRHDDVAKALEPTLEVNEQLRTFLSEHRLKQKYWLSYFANLIIDRTWNEISGG